MCNWSLCHVLTFILTLTADSIGKSRYIKLSSEDTERPDLGSARIVVTGGRALKSAENFKMIETLAEKLGAAGSFKNSTVLNL